MRPCCFLVVLVFLGLVSWVQAGREGVNVVLWKTSPQPPGSVLETPGRAACPGSTRGEVCRVRVSFPAQCRVYTRLKGGGRKMPPVAAQGRARCTGPLPKGTEPPLWAAGDRGSALGFQFWPQVSREGKPTVSAYKVLSACSTKKGRTAGVPCGRGCEVRDESSRKRWVNRKRGQSNLACGKRDVEGAPPHLPVVGASLWSKTLTPTWPDGARSTWGDTGLGPWSDGAPLKSCNYWAGEDLICPSRVET